MDILDDLRITISKLSKKLRADDTAPVEPAQYDSLTKLTTAYTALLRQMGGGDDDNGTGNLSGRSAEAEAMLQKMRRRADND